MSDLDDLKTLLFGAEKEVLDSIQQRVQLPEARAADVAAVLPEAVRLSYRENGELVESLRDPVGECVRDSIKNSPQEFADALYPIMGPAIRKSIAHALKGFAEQINRTLEHSLTAKGLKWRFQAARAGVPFASYVIQQSLLYRVEQAYLISRENGLLISHVHHDASRIKDSDAVSAMFTAIQDFVKESFSPDRTGRLETADMGEFTLWAVHGPHALLVCVIRGVPPRELRNDLSRVLERLHFRYGEPLREYAGDTSTVTGIEEELERCLLYEAARPEANEKKKTNWPLVIIILLLLAFGGYAVWSTWQQSKQTARLQAVLQATPGLYVADVVESRGNYTLHGLRDPLAATLPGIAEQAGLQPEQLAGQLRPYQSLDEAIVLQRAVQALQPEADTNVALVNDELVISGTASQRWISATRLKAATLDLGWPIRFGELSVAEWPLLEERGQALNDASFYFSGRATLDADSATRLAEYVTAANTLATEVAAIGATMTLTVTGHTDGTGRADINEQLAASRADAVVQALRRGGLDASQISVARETPQGSTADSTLRRATVTLTLNPPAR